MSNLIQIQNALCLSAPDIEALMQGRMITAMPQIFIRQGQQFPLYPSSALIEVLPFEQCYRASFLPIAQTVLSQLDSETVLIKAWAYCESCQEIANAESLEALSQLTVWTSDTLQLRLSQRQRIFLAYLRVYAIPAPVEVPVQLEYQNKIGKFISLLNPLTVSESSPVLSDRLFSQRRYQLENRLPPSHPELEELQNAIALLSATNPAAEELDQSIRIFLGWSSNQTAKRIDSDLAWIQKIAEVGNSSEGQEFEKLVRRSLIKLGFTNSNSNPKASLDPQATGGAGGIDFYCEKPYPVVGECKASKKESVPNSVTAQLIHLGHTHLGKAEFDRAIKLIVAAGPLTPPALQAAIENQMNAIRPETLQRLVELQAQHKNSIDLLELKQCLQQAPFGLADDKVNRYIDKINQDIKLRSHLVGLVKKYLENTGSDTAGVDALHGAYIYSNPPQPLKTEEIHDILIELSSPLTGYLGRIKGSDWRSDRFYFLRDLPAA
ncbi:DUF1802 family protein [Trichocoleus sp. DQ-A3]|uniref:DUF1802 family protein n=1 Tax=Cyanophyceae TaxID=3028117 RepID=UPI0016864DDC|nr:DUF1802 family protein [Coleofasciculus sp. FACHB-125]MBD1901790.1 DUF1802 family protein [Coleofasciculus sp. FACHB-125]